MQWLRGLRHQWEALSNAWNQRVLGYNPQRQRELLERLGLQDIDAGKLVAALSVAGLLIFACLYAWATRLRRSADPVERLWQAFCAKLAKRGLPRHPWEGPKDYSERLARALPDQADALRAIADCYAHLRYAPHPGAPEKRLLRHTIKALKLP
jgi:protein-glutamine gamma-glutamyltransferase